MRLESVRPCAEPLLWIARPGRDVSVSIEAKDFPLREAPKLLPIREAHLTVAKTISDGTYRKRQGRYSVSAPSAAQEEQYVYVGAI